VPDLPRKPTAGDLLRLAVSRPVLVLARAGDVVAHDGDAESVHEARVATRRLRSNLRTFRALVDTEWGVETRDELGWLGRMLGACRDADVLSLRTRGRLERLPDTWRSIDAELLASLSRERFGALRDVVDAMRSDRYVELLRRLAAATDAMPSTPAAARRARSAISYVVREWRILRRHVRSVSRPPTDAELHRIRIHAKRTRYAAEAVAPLVGKPARSFANAASDLQSVLGAHNDGVLAERWFGAWAAERSDGASFRAGMLAGIERSEADATLRAWRPAWRSVVRRRPSTW
jgi:CHAD domain-containing protein